MTTTLDPLTDRQQEIYAWIVTSIQRRGYSPTVRELCAAFSFASPNGARCHLRILRKKGYLDWQEKQSRTIRPLVEFEN